MSSYEVQIAKACEAAPVLLSVQEQLELVTAEQAVAASAYWQLLAGVSQDPDALFQQAASSLARKNRVLRLSAARAAAADAPATALGHGQGMAQRPRVRAQTPQLLSKPQNHCPAWGHCQRTVAQCQDWTCKAEHPLHQKQDVFPAWRTDTSSKGG